MDHNLQLSGSKLKLQEDHPHSLVQITITKTFDFKNHLIECNWEKDYICAQEQTGVSKHRDFVSRHVPLDYSKRLEIKSSPKFERLSCNKFWILWQIFCYVKVERLMTMVGLKLFGYLEIRYHESEQADVGTVEPVQCNDVSEGKDKGRLKDTNS